MRVTLAIGGLLTGSLLLASLAGSTPGAVEPPPGELGLLQLRKDFHLANTLGDYDLMRSLWTDDAEFVGGGNHIVGGDAITDFLASGPLWGTSVSLTSESTTAFEITGNRAQYAFECIIVHVDGGPPLETSLSSIPPGSQNPDVEILQHSNTSGVAVRDDGRWKFQVFNGAGGPL